MLKNDQLESWDRENFFHPSTHLAEFSRGNLAQRVIKTASGCHITDRDGNRLLDAFAGLYCVNVGYGRQEIAEAIADQARELETTVFPISAADAGKFPAIAVKLNGVNANTNPSRGRYSRRFQTPTELSGCSL